MHHCIRYSLIPKLFLTVTVLLLCIAVYTQENEQLIGYGVKEGLPQSDVYDISQDKDGFLWVGTAGGLARFDGYTFTNYKISADNPNAISSYKEFRFYNDSSGRLWIVHFNGISLYNALTNNFTNVLVYNPRNVVIAENHFFGEDQNYIWVGLCNYGIVKVNKKTLKVHNTPLTRTSLRVSTNVWYDGFLEKGKLWITENNESVNPIFYTYDIRLQQSDTIATGYHNIVNMNDADILATDTKFAYLINKKTFVAKKIHVLPDNKEHHIVHLFRKSPHEAILSSQTNGLFYVNTKVLGITKHIPVTDPFNKKSFLFARMVFTDKSGNIWVGTTGMGLWKIPYPFKKFHSYRLANLHNNVFALHVDSTNIYASILGHGLAKFSKNGNHNQQMLFNKYEQNARNTAYAMRSYGKDKLIIIAHNIVPNAHYIPLLYSKSTGNITLLNKEVQDVYSKNWGLGNRRNFIFRESNGNYITNVGEYLFALKPCKDNVYCPEIITQFPGENLACAFTSVDGSRWVGTFSGLFKQNNTGKWQRVTLLKNKEVKVINQDDDGNIWAATNDEIFVLNKELKTIHHYQEDKQLVNGHIYAIVKDNIGNMWFSHNKGLSVYLRTEKRFEHYDQSDGLQSNEFNINAATKASDGQLFFGGINGITAFYPHEILPNKNAPSAKIIGINIFDKPLQSDTAFWNIRKIVLPYTENSISFEYTLPEYSNQQKNSYQINMKGIDAKWISTGERRFTRYAGLQPGNYVFKVRGANNDGVFGPESSIEIIIVPPFWKTIWFYLVIAFSFISLSMGIGIYIQKIRQRKAIQAMELQHKIQMERERISRDLHDNVGTQLSLISKNIEGAIDPSQNISDAERLNNLSAISLTSKEVIFTLRETIWALNKEEISLEELSDKLKAFTQKLFALNRNCILQYTETITDKNLVLSPSEAIHLFRICQEAITNSLKYANAGAMDISIHSANGLYKIIIADDGIGFEPNINKTTAHYGLENMKFRANEIACAFSINTMPGKGTKIIISKK